MMNLEALLTGKTDEIIVDQKVSFEGTNFSHSDIKRLDDVLATGKFFKDIDEEFYLQLTVSGKMTILDAISLDEIVYPFSFDFEEKLDKIMAKDKFTIDIIELLWQNIVLEVPLGYTEVTDFSTFCGDGWKLISEEDLSLKNNPFKSLLQNEDRSD